jgi:hypothetical protein
MQPETGEQPPGPVGHHQVVVHRVGEGTDREPAGQPQLVPSPREVVAGVVRVDRGRDFGQLGVGGRPDRQAGSRPGRAPAHRHRSDDDPTANLRGPPARIPHRDGVPCLDIGDNDHVMAGELDGPLQPPVRQPRGNPAPAVVRVYPQRAQQRVPDIVALEPAGADVKLARPGDHPVHLGDEALRDLVLPGDLAGRDVLLRSERDRPAVGACHGQRGKTCLVFRPSLPHDHIEILATWPHRPTRGPPSQARRS